MFQEEQLRQSERKNPRIKICAGLKLMDQVYLFST